MSNQVIIAIGREHGSFGHEIALHLAKELQLDLYDKDILNHIASENDIDVEFMQKYDEKPRNVFASRVVNGYSSSIEDILAEKVFEYERKLAASGKSIIIVGRCAEYVLRDNPNLISVFITGDPDVKLKHIMESRGKNEDDAKEEIKSTDKQRRRYHDNYASDKWRDFSSYDLVVNSSALGLDGTVALLSSYINVWKSAEPFRSKNPTIKE